MQSIVHGASNLTAIVLRKRQSPIVVLMISKDTYCTDAYGYDSTKNGASPGSLTLSHVLPHGVILPVDSLSKRDRNRWQGVRKKTKAS